MARSGFRKRIYGAKKRYWGRGKKKFLRKYSKGLGSPMKTYAFKRLAQPMTMFATGAASGQFTASCPQPTGTNATIQLTTTSQQYGSSSDIYTVGGAMLFRLSDVASSTDFTGLFDQYRISGVKLRIWWNGTQANVGSNVPAPRMMYTVDYDDAEPATALDLILRQRNTTKIHQFANGRPLTLYIKPMSASANYNYSNLTQSYAPKRQWLDANNANTEHYGLKFRLDDVWMPEQSTTSSLFRVECTYYIKGRGVQ